MKSSTLLLFGMASTNAFHLSTTTPVQPLTQLQMKTSIDETERRRTSLSAATLQSIDDSNNLKVPNLLLKNDEVNSIMKVVSASLLVTGNTVGSSMFVLPDAVGSVGMGWGMGIFVGIYLYNLLSGLTLSTIAIHLHETSDCEVPSSFKDFADCATSSDSTAGNVIGAASLVMNSCFLSYGMVQVGGFVNGLVSGMDATMMAGLYSILLGGVFCSQKTEGIERLANGAVMILFSSFLTLLLPSLANVSDPMGTFLASGRNEDFSSALASSIPLILSTMIYQNIVPSITKLLGFDRTKSTIAIALGSFLPLLMYMGWSFAVLGGGLDNSLSNGVGGVMFTAFTASSFVGSSIGCVLSLAEEYESILSPQGQEEGTCTIDGGFSTPAVLMSVVPPAAVALAVSHGGDGAFTAPLHLSGAVIAPFLYGILPVMLFQSMQSENAESDNTSKETSLNMGMVPQWILGASTLGLLGNEVVHDCANCFS